MLRTAKGFVNAQDLDTGSILWGAEAESWPRKLDNGQERQGMEILLGVKGLGSLLEPGPGQEGHV